MIKKILLTFLLISITAHSQNVIKGTMKPADDYYKWVILYQLDGSNQKYISNVDVVEGEFNVTVPENTTKGMYRLTYDIENNGFVDFIYNNENVTLQFDPSNPSETLKFITSEENLIHTQYLAEILEIQQKIDSLQLSYLKSKNEDEQNNLASLYAMQVQLYNAKQVHFEEVSTGKLVNNFIKSSRKFNESTIVKTPQEYLNSVKSHYFDFINFNDNEIKKSVFLSEKVVDYVFYLNQSDDKQMQEVLYKKAIQDVMQKVGDDNALKSELSTTLMFTFAQIENTVLIDYIIDEVYKKLPAEYIDAKLINDVESKVKLAIGKTAPDFSWKIKGKVQKLSQFNVADVYILVFWSTTCSHCLEEVPELYEYIKDNENTHVIAFALETDEFGFNHYTQNFEKWTNVLGLDKWQNETARLYNITATPTYFVLDADKKIIAKPDHFGDVKKFVQIDLHKFIKDKPVVKTVSYVVKKGDTLYSISKKYGVTIDEIIALNKLISHSLTIGQNLKIK